MGILGVISNNLVVERSDLLRNSATKLMKNKYGRASVLIKDKMAWIIRHGNTAKSHILPHLINYRANLQALKDLDATEIVSINSTGSLRKYLCPGMIVIPDDFITLTATPTIHKNSAVHITPSLNEEVRQKLINAAANKKIKVVPKGTYWQTQGPRLETKAEIKMMTNYADIVGMTMANEAVIALELGLPYAAACSIDNFGNGLLKKPLTIEEIIAGTSKNADLMIQIIRSYLKLYS
ncbi:5'-methylthioadenosine phosphorylase [hydrocarbon metagenome]|uniref:5'-methylthioadenosine phosphorylase n=1 Tax=hydrocarbon metagenome TaxID=938273 RepID=A0A0W8FV66_9ZZZZ